MADTTERSELKVAMERLSNQMRAFCNTLPQCACVETPSSGDARLDRPHFFDKTSNAAVEQSREFSDQLVRDVKPPLPDPQVIRQIIRQRQLRSRFFNSELFSDPAWDMILDLAAAAMEHKSVSVTSLCTASCVPPTTALRWIRLLTDKGILKRVEDPRDRRRVFIGLTEEGLTALARYFELLGSDAKVQAYQHLSHQKM